MAPVRPIIRHHQWLPFELRLQRHLRLLVVRLLMGRAVAGMDILAWVFPPVCFIESDDDDD